MALNEIQSSAVGIEVGSIVESKIEIKGIDVVSEQEQTSTPKDIFFVFLGSQMCFGIIVLGAIPIALGLSFFNALTSITAGLFVGSIVFALLAPFGAKTGCSGSVASMAYFGIRGRLLGTILAIFTGLGFFTLTVWTGGEAVAASGARLLGWEVSKHSLAMGTAIITVLVIFVAIYGHKIIIASEKFVSYLVAILLAIVAIPLVGNFDINYAGSEPALGSISATWFLSLSIAAALPVSYGIFLNDYTRYVSKNVNSKKLVWAAGSGMFVGCWLALVFAAAVTTLFTSPEEPFVTGLINLVPWWAVILLVIVGVIGSQPQGSLCIYGAGLGLQTIFPKLGRITSTLILSVIGLVMVFVGIYLVDMVSFIIAFLTIDHSALAPWVIINVIGYNLINKGVYQTKDFIDLSKNKTTKFWFSKGFNFNAMLSWGMGFIVGMLFVHTEAYTGPLYALTGGIGMDWIASSLVGGGLFYILEKINGRIK